jgi:hypothetical protein
VEKLYPVEAVAWLFIVFVFIAGSVLSHDGVIQVQAGYLVSADT